MTRLYIFFIVIIAFSFYSCNQESEKSIEKKISAVGSIAKVEVYYFHGKRRCKTCVAVENLARNTVQEYYKNKDVAFIDVNIDEVNADELIEQFKVAGTGLIIYGNSDYEDLTTLAFTKTLSSPEEVKIELRKTIDGKI